MGVREYGELKQRMLTTTGAAVVAGCAIFAAMSQDGRANQNHESLEPKSLSHRPAWWWGLPSSVPCLRTARPFARSPFFRYVVPDTPNV
jgi:hypothetical protein